MAEAVAAAGAGAVAAAVIVVVVVVAEIITIIMGSKTSKHIGIVAIVENRRRGRRK